MSDFDEVYAYTEKERPGRLVPRDKGAFKGSDTAEEITETHARTYRMVREGGRGKLIHLHC